MSNKTASIKMNGTISILFSRQSKSGKPKKFIQLFCENKKKKKKSISEVWEEETMQIE